MALMKRDNGLYYSMDYQSWLHAIQTYILWWHTSTVKLFEEVIIWLKGHIGNSREIDALLFWDDTFYNQSIIIIINIFSFISFY